MLGSVRMRRDYDAGLLGGSGDLDHMLRGVYVVGRGNFVAVHVRRALYGHLLVRVGRGGPCRFGLGRASVGDGSGTFDLDVVLFVVLSPRVVRLEVGRRVARYGDVGRPFADSGQLGRLDVARNGCGREQCGSGLGAYPEALPAGIVGVGVVRAVGVAFPPCFPQFGRFHRTAVVGRAPDVVEERVGGVDGVYDFSGGRRAVRVVGVDVRTDLGVGDFDAECLVDRTASEPEIVEILVEDDVRRQILLGSGEREPRLVGILLIGTQLVGDKI